MLLNKTKLEYWYTYCVMYLPFETTISKIFCFFSQPAAYVPGVFVTAFLTFWEVTAQSLSSHGQQNKK